MTSFKEAKGHLPCASTSNTWECGIPLPARAERVQSHRSTRGSHAPPRSAGKRRTGECALRGAGDEPAGERDDWSNVVNPAPDLDPKGRGNNSMVRKGRWNLSPTGQRSVRKGVCAPWEAQETNPLESGTTGAMSLIQHLTWTRKGEGTIAWCEKAGETWVPQVRGRSGRVYRVKADCLNPSHGGSRASRRRKGDRCLCPVLCGHLPCLCRTPTGANPQGVGKRRNGGLRTHDVSCV